VKLDARQVVGFLRKPGSCRAVLLFGEDEGLIRERAHELTEAVAGSLNDPFRVAELDRDGWPRIAEEMSALSLIGGRRVVRVREVSDAAAEPVRAALRGTGDALLVLEAPGLGKGKLRTLIEAAPEAAAIGCYPEEGRALQDLIRTVLAELGASADMDAVAWLAEATGGDRAVVRSEVEKLALLAGAGGRIDLEMARASAGDAAGASAEAGLVAATRGDAAAADHEVERALGEGLAAIALLRMALGHLQRLHQARLRMQDGLSAADAVRFMRPPVFYKAVGGMIASVTLWSTENLVRAIDEARLVEIGCKQTGSRQELLVRRFVAGLARQAQGRLRS
jgi:DNA polymerase-3 subunit delta